jgi:hypothetical protein
MKFLGEGERPMRVNKMLILALAAYLMVTSACKYIVPPEGLSVPAAEKEGSETKAWNAVVTNVTKTGAGDLHIDLTLRNDTGDWSTMQAVEGVPAVLAASDGKKTNCDTVFMGTGGHRLAPGFQMRGYIPDKKAGLNPQMLYVECKGVEAAPGMTLSLDYESITGLRDDYNPDENKTEGKLELNLDEVVADLTYPIATPIDGLVQDAGTSITALSDNVITLLDTQRTDAGFQFTWENYNPTKFPLKTHIGTPPVIGADGIIYGPYETLDILDVPITPAKEKMQWQTEVAVPQDGKGFYILLSVESKKPRTYVNYALDISDK